MDAATWFPDLRHGRQAPPGVRVLGPGQECGLLGSHLGGHVAHGGTSLRERSQGRGAQAALGSGSSSLRPSELGCLSVLFFFSLSVQQIRTVTVGMSGAAGPGRPVSQAVGGSLAGIEAGENTVDEGLFMSRGLRETVRCVDESRINMQLEVFVPVMGLPFESLILGFLITKRRVEERSHVTACCGVLMRSSTGAAPCNQ